MLTPVWVERLSLLESQAARGSVPSYYSDYIYRRYISTIDKQNLERVLGRGAAASSDPAALPPDTINKDGPKGSASAVS